MHYAVVGRISAVDFLEGQSLENAQVYLRLYNGGLHLGSEFQIGSVPIVIDLEREFAGFGEHYLGREPLDHEGRFEIGIDDRQHPYAGGPLRAVLELPFVKPNSITTAKHVSQFWVLETFTPIWKSFERSASTTWNHRFETPAWSIFFPEIELNPIG
jgi:hypothetical protein